MTVIGALLLFDPGRYGLEQQRLFPAPPAGFQWALVGLALAGFAFCWWARLTLGTLWSSSVTRKADHHIVEAGPYAFVRHPIYTGLIGAAVATAAIRASALALLGLALMIFGFWLKARLAERFLRAELGPDAYDAYARRTGMLLPYL